MQVKVSNVWNRDIFPKARRLPIPGDFQPLEKSKLTIVHLDLNTYRYGGFAEFIRLQLESEEG